MKKKRYPTSSFLIILFMTLMGILASGVISSEMSPTIIILAIVGSFGITVVLWIALQAFLVQFQQRDNNNRKK